MFIFDWLHFIPSYWLIFETEGKIGDINQYEDFYSSYSNDEWCGLIPWHLVSLLGKWIAICKYLLNNSEIDLQI